MNSPLAFKDPSLESLYLVLKITEMDKKIIS